MPKQCKQCGDYFYTTVKRRQFCSRPCATINAQDPSKKKDYPNNYRKPVTNIGDTCYLCNEFVSIGVLVPVCWDGHYHDICPGCATSLAEKVDEAGLTEEEVQQIFI
jgi:hypothetical protein